MDAVPATPARPDAAVLDDSRSFAKPDAVRSTWQLVTTLALTIAGLVVIARADSIAVAWAIVPVQVGLFVRVFTLQHDCGHQSLYARGLANDAAGTLLSFLTGIPYLPWRTEHNWHHAHQGKLEVRGIDRVNSPMTVAEAGQSPADAQLRARLISLPAVGILGIHSLLVKRKRLVGFFMFRPNYRWRVPEAGRLRVGLVLTIAGHVGVHAAMLAGGGWARWGVTLVAMLLGAAVGSVLFWIQHNFTDTFHADATRWSFVAMAVRGSSYVRLPAVFAWFTSHIGLHHVHHLNPRIPNYRLEDARTRIPELAAVAPMSAAGFRACFTHVFWDEARGHMVPYDALASAERAVETAAPDVAGSLNA